MGPKWIEKCKYRYKKVLIYILDSMEIKDRETPLRPENLANPNGKYVCLILYLYSMQSPLTQLYSSGKLSENDPHLLNSIGPFDRCLQQIVNSKAEMNRLDCHEPSSKMSAPSSFLVYKGTLMSVDAVQQWKEVVGKKIRLPSITSFSENLREAMFSANIKANKQQQIVLFMMAFFNQSSYPGFRLSNEKYSPYPDEQEILIPAGCNFEVEGYDLFIP